MVGKPINLSYLVVGLHGLKIFEIRFGEKVHIVQGSNVNYMKVHQIVIQWSLVWNDCGITSFRDHLHRIYFNTSCKRL